VPFCIHLLMAGLGFLLACYVPDDVRAAPEAAVTVKEAALGWVLSLHLEHRGWRQPD
jgi:hypothetical protein